MGYDKNRFANENVDDELICAICSSVLEEPLQAPVCEHAFCAECIKEWLSLQNTCPIDRLTLTVADLKPAPRILRNLLSRLDITCDYATDGCEQVVKLDSLASHCNECQFNPKRPVKCEKGCDLVIPKDQLQNHNCIKDLRSYIDNESQKWEQQFRKLKKSINSLQDCLKFMNQTSPQACTSSGSSTTTGIPFWYQALPRARVLRWGGLISTPDVRNQEVIKKSLIEAGCPHTMAKDLVENSHEQNWPPGLVSLEIRQINRDVFRNYFCRKIPGHLAVLVMSVENQHMTEDMMLDPGLVMIFAHGIEEMSR